MRSSRSFIVSANRALSSSVRIFFLFLAIVDLQEVDDLLEPDIRVEDAIENSVHIDTIQGDFHSRIVDVYRTEHKMTDRDSAWAKVAGAILSTPGALSEETRRAIAQGEDPPELAPLLDKVRRHAYRIVDRDLEGLDPDAVIEASLAAALGVALEQRRAALDAIG
jgi:hypothetical protein